MNVLSLISVVQTKDRELAEAQQQLRQKVNVKSFLVTYEMILLYFTSLCSWLQEEQLLSSEREKETVRQRLMLQVSENV